MKPAISVENLGKSYRVTHESSPRGYRTMRESLTHLAAAPFRRFRNIGADGASSEEFWALKDVSFEVQPGEVVGIVGRNGAGKSTLLKVLSRITKPTKGNVAIHGRVGSLLEVGTGFHQELTGRENIFLNGSILGMSTTEIKQQFDAIVAFAEIDRFLDTPVKRYSSGMYVRLAFAVAAHLRPEILIVDEVLAVGDQSFQRKCIGKIGDVARSGLSVLLVSHQMETIRRLCPTSLYLDRGRAVSFGPTNDVISAYEREAPILLQPRTRYAIGALPRASGNADLTFQSITYTSDRDDLSGGAYSSGPLTVEVEVDCKKAIDANSLSFILFGMDKVKVLNADILSLGAHRRLPPGISRIIFKLHCIHLKPNRYVIGLWAGMWPRETFDYLQYVGEIDINRDAELLGPPSDGFVTVDFTVETCR